MAQNTVSNILARLRTGTPQGVAGTSSYGRNDLSQYLGQSNPSSTYGGSGSSGLGGWSSGGYMATGQTPTAQSPSQPLTQSLAQRMLSYQRPQSAPSVQGGGIPQAQAAPTYAPVKANETQGQGLAQQGDQLNAQLSALLGQSQTLQPQLQQMMSEFNSSTSIPQLDLSYLKPVTDIVLDPGPGGNFSDELRNQVTLNNIASDPTMPGPMTQAMTQNNAIPSSFNPPSAMLGIDPQAIGFDSGVMTGMPVSGGAGGGEGQLQGGGDPWYASGQQSAQSWADLVLKDEQSRRNEAAQREQLKLEALRNNIELAKFQQKTNLQNTLLPAAMQIPQSILEMFSQQPGINQENPFDPRIAQMRANAAQASAQQQSRSAAREISDSMTGAGFGGSSPALYANQLNALMSGVATGTQNATQVLTDYDKAKADWQLSAMIAASQARQGDIGNLIDLYGSRLGLVGNLLG